MRTILRLHCKYKLPGTRSTKHRNSSNCTYQSSSTNVYTLTHRITDTLPGSKRDLNKGTPSAGHCRRRQFQWKPDTRIVRVGVGGRLSHLALAKIKKKRQKKSLPP